MDNSIYQYAIGELLDGRYFYIPSYQRGYRWTVKQVGDLLRDLLCFANDFANEEKEKKQDQFYCLQPIIARSITDEEKLKSIFKDEYNDDIKEHGVWEIIDGQQRLTTIFLLYKYLMDQKGWDAETLKEEEDGKELYHICYATRDGSAKILEGMSMKMIKDNSEEDFKQNVDFFHMANAFKYIAEWIRNDGKAINIRYQLGGSLDNIRTSFFKLLNGMSDTKGGSVQVLWYEIAESKETNNIKEFQNDIWLKQEREQCTLWIGFCQHHELRILFECKSKKYAKELFKVLENCSYIDEDERWIQIPSLVHFKKKETIKELSAEIERIFEVIR